MFIWRDSPLALGLFFSFLIFKHTEETKIDTWGIEKKKNQPNENQTGKAIPTTEKMKPFSSENHIHIWSRPMKVADSLLHGYDSGCREGVGLAALQLPVSGLSATC